MNTKKGDASFAHSNILIIAINIFHFEVSTVLDKYCVFVFLLFVLRVASMYKIVAIGVVRVCAAFYKTILIYSLVIHNFFFSRSNFIQILLTLISRTTKISLNSFGVFTVSSFHAFICARSPSLLNNLLAGRGATKRRTPLLSRSNSGSSRRSMQVIQLIFETEPFYPIPHPMKRI